MAVISASLQVCNVSYDGTIHFCAGGVGAVAGRVSGADRTAWASAVPVMARRGGAHVSTFQIGATVLSHLEAKPVSTRLGARMPGEGCQETPSFHSSASCRLDTTEEVIMAPLMRTLQHMSTSQKLRQRGLWPSPSMTGLILSQREPVSHFAAWSL